MILPEHEVSLGQLAKFLDKKVPVVSLYEETLGFFTGSLKMSSKDFKVAISELPDGFRRARGIHKSTGYYIQLTSNEASTRNIPLLEAGKIFLLEGFVSGNRAVTTLIN